MKVKTVLKVDVRFSQEEMGTIIGALDTAAQHGIGIVAHNARNLHTQLMREVNGINESGEFIGPKTEWDNHVDLETDY